MVDSASGIFEPYRCHSADKLLPLEPRDTSSKCRLVSYGGKLYKLIDIRKETRSMQILANGLISGLVLATLALGFQSVYLPTRIFFITQAGIYGLAPYIAMQVRQANGPWIVAIALSLLASVLVAIAAEAFNHRRLTKRGASSGIHLIASLGLYIILVQLIAMIWGNETKVLRTGVDTTVYLASVVLTRAQVIAGLASLAVIVGFYLWLRSSNIGLQFRALADNPTQLALYGYNTDRLRLLAFGLSGFLTATASLLTAYDIGFDPHGGLPSILLAVVAVIIGGRGSFLAPICGGILLGILRAQVVWHGSARWQEAATFGLLALFLLFRPHGLLGSKMRLEADS
jgi:branched-chain amino acid transport system permease protein